MNKYTLQYITLHSNNINPIDRFLNCPMEELVAVIEAGEEWQKYATPEQLQAQKEAGRGWVLEQHPEAIETLRQIGREAFKSATPAQKRAILGGKSYSWESTREEQIRGAKEGHKKQSAKAAARERIPKPPPLTLHHDKWECPAVTGDDSFCQFECVADLALNNMIGRAVS